MQQLVLMLHVIIAIALVVLVLLQQGKGAEMGAAFGSGASQTLFGSQGSSSFMLKITGILAVVFFSTSLLLGYLAAHHTKVDPLQGLTKLEQQKSIAQKSPTTTAPVVPTAGVPLSSDSSNKPNKPAQP